MAQAFAGTSVAGLSVTGTLSDWTVTKTGTAQLAYTSTTNAANVANISPVDSAAVAAATTIGAGTATNGSMGQREYTTWTMRSLSAGQSYELDGKTVYAVDDMTAAQVASAFTTSAGYYTSHVVVGSFSTPTGWTGIPVATTVDSGGTQLRLTNTVNGNVTNYSSAPTSNAAVAALSQSVTETAGVDPAGGLTINGLASGGTFELNGNNQSFVSLNVTGAAAGTNESVNLKLASAGALTGGTVNAADVENVAITTVDTNDVAHVDTLTLVDAAAESITVAGNAGLDLTFTGTALTSFDASGVTKGEVTWTTGALSNAATIKGGNDGNTIDFTAATKAVTFSGGDGVDTVTASNANNVISTGNGDDVVILGSGNNTVDLGAGDDVITLGSGQNTVTLGAGEDTVIVAAPVNGNSYSTILDIEQGDILQFVDQGTETFEAAGIVLQGTAAFQDYLDAATAGDGSADGKISWFQYGDDTYVVEDLSSESTFQNGTDVVIKLAGMVDLSTATAAGHELIIA